MENNKNKTAIEWLVNELKSQSIDLTKWHNDLVEQAKEMEKTSMCSFTTGYVNNCVEIDHNEIELTKEVEEYYDWLESTKCQRDEDITKKYE